MCHEVMRTLTCLVSVTMIVTGVMTSDDQDSAPTSHWASVYTGDTTDHTAPVTNQHFPLPDHVSRSDWFDSYPYHKYQDSSEDRNDEEQGLLDNVVDAVDNVRQALKDFGDGVVDSALGLVGVNSDEDEEDDDEEKLLSPDEYQERDGPQSESQYHPQYQHHQQHLNNRLATEELAAEDNSDRSTFAKADNEDISPIEKFRRGVRSYLDPIVDPMVDPIKRLFQTDDNDRRQSLFRSPLTHLKNFGDKVSEGLTILTGGTSSPAQVSHVSARTQYSGHDPILSEASQAQAYYAHQYDPVDDLPLLPPLFIPASQPSPDNVQHARAPQHHHHQHHQQHQHQQHQHQRHQQRQYQEAKRITVYPPTSHDQSQEDVSYNEISDQPLHLSIVPLLKAAFRRKKEIISRDIPSLLGLGAPHVQDVHQKTEVTKFIIPEPVLSNDVMYYMAPPDLSSGHEREGSKGRAGSKTGHETKLFPENYFDQSSGDNVVAGGDYDGKSGYFKDVQDADSTTAINLSQDTAEPDIIIVDISQTIDDNDDEDDLEDVYQEIFENEVESFEPVKLV